MSADSAVGFAQAGKSWRLSRVFGRRGRTVLVALDHALMLGDLGGLVNPPEMVRRFVGSGCDGFVLSGGVARQVQDCFRGRGAPARVVTIDNFARDAVQGGSSLVFSAASAAALGADALKVMLAWDVPARERRHNAALVGKAVGDADSLGLPVMVEVVGSGGEVGGWPGQGEGCLVAAELGADIVKTGFPGDPEVFAGWCGAIGVPMVVLGGPFVTTEEELLTSVRAALQAGGRGVVMGRQVWQRPAEEAERILRRLADLVAAGGGCGSEA